MSTLRTNTLQTTDSSFSIDVNDLTSKALLAGPTGSDQIGHDSGTVSSALDDLYTTRSDWLTTASTGILSVEQGAVSPVAEAAKWESLRVLAETEKRRVWIGPGTYVLPQGVRLDADDTVWEFSPGSLLKLWDTQATDDFILIDRPVNQRIKGLRVDANRANQVSATFGIDNCACLVVSPDTFYMENTEIVSSPAKGLAIVSAATETSRNWTIQGFKGADCQYQVLLVDGNNATGFFQRGHIDDVKIGNTGGFGLAINDGAHDINVSNVISDVGNIISDGVFLRDVWDINLSNVVGRNGRNGVQIVSFVAPLTAKRINLENVVGEMNEQSGILILAASDISGGTVIGRNNKSIGINIQWTSGVNKCRRINITNPVAYDDGGVAVQDYGLFVAGCQDSVLGRGNQFRNTVANVSFTAAANTNVEFPLEKVQTVSVGAIAASSFLNVVVAWPTPMPDDSYFEEAVLEVGTTTLSVALGHANGRTANQVSFLVRNLTASPISAGAVTLRAKAKRIP